MSNIKKNYLCGRRKSGFVLFTIAILTLFTMLLIIDEPVTIFVKNLNDNIIAPFKIITRAGNSDWILIPSLLGLVFGFIISKQKFAKNIKEKATRIFIIASFIFTSVALPGIVANLIKRTLGRARPMNIDEYGIFHFNPFSNWQFQSFPSGDATTIFSLFVALTFLMPKYKYLFLFGAILVSLSRIMVGVHFPSDVFGGILLGTFGAYFVRNYYIKKGWL